MATGFGSDLSCGSALHTGRIVSGKRLLSEAIIRRLSTPRGTLTGGDEERAYGIDLAGYVGAVGTDAAVAALPGVVEAELLKDDRIARVAVSVARLPVSDGVQSLEVTIDVTPADESGDFTLTLAVSALGMSLLGGVS